MPTYKPIWQLKSESPNRFHSIIPILGAFHQQMSYMYAIYKRFKVSGMADTLVAAGVIAGGSVDQALRGKHYRRGLRCILLWREVLIYKRLQGILCNKELSDNIKEKIDVLRHLLDTQTEVLANIYEVLKKMMSSKSLWKKSTNKPGQTWETFGFLS